MNADRTECLKNEDGQILYLRLTPVGYAVRAIHIRAALKFDHWVGSETMPLRGGFERVAGSEGTAPQLKGWAYDPLNPAAQLPIEVYVNGEKGTGTEVGTFSTDQVHSGINTIDGISGKHGYTWTIPAPHRTGDPAWYVYARDQDTDTTQNPAIRTRLPELKLPANRTVRDELLEFIRDYEGLDGFIPYPYDDQDSSVPRKGETVFKENRTTICYGHLIDHEEEFDELVEIVDNIESLPDEATKEMRRKEFCEGLFRKDWEDHADIVKRQVKVPVSQSCFDGLTSLAFNLGEPQFAGSPDDCVPSPPEKKCYPPSSVWKKLQNPPQATPDYPTLEAAWKAWRVDKGQVNCGLIRRRRDDWTMCDRGVYDRTDNNRPDEGC